MSMDRSNRKWLAVIAFSLVFAALLVSIPKTPVIAASPPLESSTKTATARNAAPQACISTGGRGQALLQLLLDSSMGITTFR